MPLGFGRESPREEMRAISDGKVKNHFIGKKSIEVKIQELTSHIQNFQETFSKQAKKEWFIKLRELEDQL